MSSSTQYELVIQYNLIKYPYYTINHPQAFPKFWANLFMVDKIDQSDQSLINIFLKPSTFSGVVESNKVKDMVYALICQSFQTSNLYMIQVMVETLYTFGSSLDYTMTLTKSLPFDIWVSSQTQGSTQSTISVNGANLAAFNPLV